MKTAFVDSNVFLRFLTRDDEGQRRRASALFHRAAAGEVDLVSGPPVLFEVAWTLRSVYGIPRERTLDMLDGILSLPGLRLVDRALVEEAVALARRCGQDFADAYIAVSVRHVGADEVASFNRRHFEAMGTDLHEF